MAENIEANQGNIKNEFNSAATGLNLDNSINQIPKGALSYALNASVENFDSSSINYQNEQGNEWCLSFPLDYSLIGTYFINEKNKHIFFLVNTLSNDSQIGYMDNNDCEYKVLLESPCLNFNINYPIHKVVHKITNCSIEIYWTDGLNPRRYLDINNIPYKLSVNSTLCAPVYSKEIDCNQLNVQPNFVIPNLEILKIETGGSISEGVYQFGIQYGDPVGNPFTSFYSITNPTPIFDPQIVSLNFNSIVGKSIILKVDNLDISGQYQYFNIAVIKTINAISSVELVGTYFIEGSSKNITYTGQNVENIRLSINDIFEKFPYYEIAQDLTTVQDILVWDNLTSVDRINYQEIATQIDLQWETYKIPANENYGNELNATNLRGYLRDEIYAIEIVFLLTNGKQTDGFHIPGRKLTNEESVLPNILDTNPDFIGEPLLGENYSPYWKIYNTASVTGKSTNDPIGNAKAHEYGEFAYWESEETYPCNQEMWGELSGKNIRHHKFPDNLVSPHFESNEFLGEKLLSMDNAAIYPIGIKIDINQVKELINASSLPSEIKNSITGFKIVRGDRGTNKSIIGKGILRNVGTYKKEEQSYYFPNYPYNDISEDPFLNKNNNAWTQLCESFNINVLKFNKPDGDVEKTYLEIEYTDCNTNKKATHSFTTLGLHTWCSMSKPIVLGEGLVNKVYYTPGDSNGPTIETDTLNQVISVAVVGYSNYDIYRISVSGSRAGWRAGWEDPILGYTTLWVAGGWFNSPATFYVHTKKETTVVNVGGSSYEEIDARGIVRSTECQIEAPLDPIVKDETLAYRQIFNSPETSFGQPFLGDTLKLENVIYGAGKAHFVEVKKNAKYRLLTEEAQRDALSSCVNIGSITNPFNATAMFTAYQAYLQIYINGITRKNYAYSYNSIANYNYNEPINNNLGVKQRKIDLKKYLIPGVQAVGEKDININNYNRETSVYLRTKGTDKTIDALPFPQNSPSFLVNGLPKVIEKSRYTVTEAGNCAAPAKEIDLSVVSYYGSLKNTFANQWGQIYSYNTIDTGYQIDFNNNFKNSTIFGGDTFISKFAFKTKFPFFIDNRVGAPDDSDIFYDEIGNIGYPKYWHSARSILKDYTIPVAGPASGLISYKAHNFDCPNDQEPGPPTVTSESNINRTFYDGYYYLFSYGIPSFYCETSYNLDLRQSFNNKEGDFWPHVSSGIPDDWVQESFVPIAQDNTYYYNTTFSKQNKENFFSHLPADWSDKLCFTNYPFRSIYSDLQSTDADNKVNNWLIYRATSYFDFPQNYGKLISLDGVENRAVLARFENKSLLYNSLLTIDTSNPQAAYLGNPVLFKSAPPIDFAETDLGHIGSQNKFLLKIPNGKITIDAKRGQIFLIQGQQAEDLSRLGSGMNRFLTDHLAFEILRWFPEHEQIIDNVKVIIPGVNTDNHYNGIGLHGVYDSKFDRIIITKIDYIPLNNNIKYNPITKEFYLIELKNNIKFTTVVDLKDENYFCNKSWTISYNFNTKSWISFHSYIPNWYIGENNFFYSGTNETCEEFDFIAGELIPTPITTTTTTLFIPVTTTSTTIQYLDCSLEGNIQVINCELEGNGIIIIPSPDPVCKRPLNMNSFNFITGYTILASSSIVNSSNTQEDACISIAYLNTLTDLSIISLSVIKIEANTLELFSTVYVSNGTTDCTVVEDGWYYTDESIYNNTTYHVENGIITEIVSCINTSTTTTTQPVINDCCTILVTTGTGSVFLDNLSTGEVSLLDIPEYTEASYTAMTSNYLWALIPYLELGSEYVFRQWDIYTTPFSATYNRDISFPDNFEKSFALMAKDDETLITVNLFNAPIKEVVEMNIIEDIAVMTTKFALTEGIGIVAAIMLVNNEKLLVLYSLLLEQYDYATGVLEQSIVLAEPVLSMYECNSTIYLVGRSGNLYMLIQPIPYSILDLGTFIDVTAPYSITQINSCIITPMPTTTTTTTL